MLTTYPGEREKLQVFTFKVPREWIEAIERTAEENNTSKSRLARAAFWDYFNKHNIEI